MHVDYVNDSRLSGRRRFVLRRRRKVADDLLQLVLVLLEPIYCFGRSLGLCRRGLLLLNELQGLENVGADCLHKADEGVIVVRARDCCEFRAKPGVLTYSTPGDGSVHHLQQELLNAAVGVKMVHVPYVGGAPAMLDAISGVVDLNVGSPAQGIQQVEAGKLKALSYTGEKRSALLPNVPTVAESAVPGFYAALWGGVLAPGRTPKAVVARINADIRQVMNQPDVRDKMAKLGTDVVTSSPEAFDKFIRAELTKWSGVAKQAGVKGE